MFKKTCIVLFVLLILTQSGGFSLYHVVSVQLHKASMWAKAKKEIKSGKSTEKLEPFSEDQLASAEWEHEREFFLNGEKYDVMRKTKVNGKTIYHCINDKREEEIKRKLDNGKKHSKVFEDIIKKICLQTPSIHQSFSFLEYPERHYFSFTEPHYISNYSSRSFRPPIAFIG